MLSTERGISSIFCISTDSAKSAGADNFESIVLLPKSSSIASSI